MNFDYFQIKEMNLTNRAEKVDKKKWGYLSSFHVSFMSCGL